MKSGRLSHNFVLNSWWLIIYIYIYSPVFLLCFFHQPCWPTSFSLFKWTAMKRGRKWNILCTYIRNVEIVMHDLYCLHYGIWIYHVILQKTFSPKHGACWWNQNKSSASLTWSPYGGINRFAKLESLPISFDFLLAVYKELL